MALSRVFAGIQTDFVCVIVNNALEIYSLSTGQQMTKGINLIGKNLNANPISCVSVAGYTKCIVAAAGAYQDRLFLFDIEDINTGTLDEKIEKTGISSRVERMPSQFIVRHFTIAFILYNF